VQVNVNEENSTRAVPKPLNRWSLKVTAVVTLGTLTTVQNYYPIKLVIF